MERKLDFLNKIIQGDQNPEFAVVDARYHFIR